MKPKAKQSTRKMLRHESPLTPVTGECAIDVVAISDFDTIKYYAVTPPFTDRQIMS